MHIDADALDKFAQKNNITMILLFGSRVTGEHREDSDMDLGLLFRDNGYDYKAVIRELMNIFPRRCLGHSSVCRRSKKWNNYM